jgi:predicted RNA binding protein YcfA (HicA-like mRNA interferase family)
MSQKPMTYAELERVLKRLGFAVEVAEGKSRTYRHAATGALIPLPDRPRETGVLPQHLAAVEGVLEAYGLRDVNGRPHSPTAGRLQKL